MILGILVPDGIGIKNYLYTNFPALYFENPDNKIVLLYCGIERQLLEETMQQFPGRATLCELPRFTEKIPFRVIRESITIGRLRYFSRKLSNPTIMEAVPNAHTWRRKILLGVAGVFGRIMSRNYKAILRWEKIFQHQVSRLEIPEFESILRQQKIDVILSLHQRPPENIPVFEAARRLNIRRTTVIYSWDNVAKARLYSTSEKYFLWSNYMKSQMRLFYPEIPEESLVVTGTPQFSFYFSKDYMMPRDKFFEANGLNQQHPIVLFSGSDFRTSPYDPYLLRDVAEALQSIEEQERPSLVFRRTPADFSDRYNWVFQKYPWIKVMDPLWINKGNSWSSAVPTRQDLVNIVNLIRYCSIVVNVASTMALDAATHNKPCIYLSYHPLEARQQGWPVYNDTHDEDHFKAMKNIEAVCYVEHENKLPAAIFNLLHHPDDYAKGRAKYLEIITDNLYMSASQSLASQIMALQEMA